MKRSDWSVLADRSAGRRDRRDPFVASSNERGLRGNCRIVNRIKQIRFRFDLEGSLAVSVAAATFRRDEHRDAFAKILDPRKKKKRNSSDLSSPIRPRVIRDSWDKNRDVSRRAVEERNFSAFPGRRSSLKRKRKVSKRKPRATVTRILFPCLPYRPEVSLAATSPFIFIFSTLLAAIRRFSVSRNTLTRPTSLLVPLHLQVRCSRLVELESQTLLSRKSFERVRFRMKNPDIKSEGYGNVGGRI